MGNLPCRNVQVVRSVKNEDDDDDDDDDIIDKQVRLQIDTAFKTLQESETCVSLLKKHLTKDTFDSISKKTSLYGGTLLDVIQSGVRNLDSEVGVYAPDAESYTLFASLFDKIIYEYHSGFSSIDRHPPLMYGDPMEVGNIDADDRFVLCTRVRAARSIQGYPLNSLLTRDQYSGIESRMFTTLGRLSGDVAGEYYPLRNLPDSKKRQLTDANLMMREGDRFMQAANASRDWPTGRGVFFNADKTFVIWVNEEDHLRVISMEDGADLAQVYGRLIDGLSQLEEMMSFSRSSRLGFVTFSLTELGCALRASVLIRLPRLANKLEKLMETADKLKLRVRGTDGEQHLIKDGVVEVSNKRTLGVTEISAVKEMANGVRELIRLEKFS